MWTIVALLIAVTLFAVHVGFNVDFKALETRGDPNPPSYFVAVNPQTAALYKTQSGASSGASSDATAEKS